MKKYFFLLLGILVLSASIQAQDGKDQLKQASKSISKYKSDPYNVASLQDAIDNINLAMSDPIVNQTAKAWITKGEVYNAYADGQIKANLLDPNVKFTDPRSAVIAFNAFSKALEYAEKKGEIKDALYGLTEVEGHLNNTGIAMYTSNDYSTAYDNFSSAINTFKILKDNDKPSRLDDPAVYKDQVFFTAVAGYYGEKVDEVIPYLEEMKASGTDQAFVYEALYNAYKESDEAKAVSVLEEGRAQFPEDTGILFAEINHYLNSGKLEVLIDKLKFAMEKEPDNVSIFTTMGNVYDNLHSTAKKDGDSEKASEYFDLSKDYYTQALTKDSSNFDAQYSLGALYYNKAADMTGDLNAFSNDFSKEGTKKYNDLKAVMDGLFEQALPYFQKAEEVDATDLNTMIALKEIYARKNMFDKSNEYKARIDALKGEDQE